MRTLPDRRHIRHFEVPGGTCHVTWRIAAGQEILAPAERGTVLAVMRRGAEFDCHFHAAVVMDDHVHALFTPGRRADSAHLVSAWKSVSSHLIIKAGLRASPLWQRDYYQHWIASPRLIDICTSYLLANPARKWPGTRDYPWVIPPG